MPEIDLVIPGLTIVQEGIFDTPDLLQMMKSWFKKHGYYTAEEQFEQGENEGLGTMKVKYVNSKQEDDYIQFLVIVVTKISNQKSVVVEVKGKKQKKTQGKLDIKIVAKIKSDYQATWEGSPTKKFFRGVYDKFVAGDKKEKFEAELKKFTEAFFHEVKAYLKLHQT